MPTPLPDHVAARLDGLKSSGDGWIARCVCHEDRNPSLSLRVTDDGKVLVKCHAGCEQEALVDALGLRSERSNDDDSVWTPAGEAVAVYDYRDEDGTLLFQVCRTATKDFRQRVPDRSKKSGWRWSLGDTKRVLFRLPELIRARDEGLSVCIAEGEKDVLALVGAGRVATCNPMGAGKWRSEFAAYFVDLDVTIFADKDKPGRDHARQVAASLDGVAARVWVVEAADPHKDIAAHLAAGLPLSAVTVTIEPASRVTPELAIDILDFLKQPDPDYDWLIEGLIERGERLMITGWEGYGKSVLCRQLAVCIAAGLHPFTFAPCTNSRTVLFIDCENTERQNRRQFRPLVNQAARDGHSVPRGALRIVHQVEGVDLTTDDDAAWLIERVTAHKPDVVVIGTLYKLHRGDMNDERAARRLTTVLDRARGVCGSAVIVEAHSGHAGDGINRSVRPRGSSLFLGWPEFGYGIRPFELPDGTKTDERDKSPLEFKAWRGPRDERSWPEYVCKSFSDGWAWREWLPPSRFVEAAS